MDYFNIHPLMNKILMIYINN